MKFRIICILLAVHSFTGIFSGLFAYVAGSIVDSDLSATGKSIGSGGAYPTGLGLHLVNPAQLIYVSKYDFMGGYQADAFETSQTIASGSFRMFGLPYAVTYAMLTPQFVDEISDEGNSLAQASFYEFFTGISSAHTTEIRGFPVHWGYTAKMFHGRIDTYSAYSFAVDLAAIVPVHVRPLQFFQTSSKENLLVSVSVNNLSTPFRFAEEEQFLPTSATAGLDYIVWENRNNRVDILSSLKYYFVETNAISDLRMSVAAQYLFFRTVALRSGFSHQGNFTSLILGTGVSYSHNEMYNLRFDYCFSPGIYGSSHTFSTNFQRSFSNFSEKFQKGSAAQLETSRDIDAELLLILNNGVKEYKLKNGSNPQQIENVLPYLEKEGMTRIPDPLSGMLFYEANSGQVKIIERHPAEFNVTLVLRDGRHIIGKIENMGAGKNEPVIIKHLYGTMSVQKKDIEYFFNNKLKSLDEALLKEVQNYINEYKTKFNRYPASLRELEIYLGQYQLQNLPMPSMGSFVYDAKKGTLVIANPFSTIDALIATPEKNKPVAPKTDSPKNKETPVLNTESPYKKFNAEEITR